MPVLAKDLRAAVLQAAIQGRLTKQLPEDGDARDLLAQIKDKKEQLIKDKKIKKEKPFAPIEEDEIPFDIPDNWFWALLPEITKNISAGGDKPKRFSKTKTDTCIYPVFSNGETNDGLFGYTDECRVTEEAITVSGRGTIGFSVIREPNFTPIVRLLVLTFCPNSVNLKYIKMVLNCLLESGIGSAVKQLTVPMIQKKAIPIPPLTEQHRIVARVEELMAMIDEYEKIEKQLEELKEKFPGDMKAALLQAAIQGKLTQQLPEDGDASDLLIEIKAEKEQLIKDKKIKKEKPLAPIEDDGIPFDIPNNWEWVKLGTISSYAQTKEKASKEDKASSIWSLDLEDIEKDSGKILNFVSAKSRKITGDKTKFYKGQVLYSKLRPYLLKILVAPEDGICTSEIIPFSLYGNIYSEYVVKYLKCPYADQIINAVTYGVKMPRVGTDTMTNLLVPLPPLAEQQRIVEILDKLLPMCDELTE